MNLTNSWKNYFQSLPQTEEINKNIEALATATLLTDNSTPDATISSLTEDPDSVIMIITPITSKIKLLHSISNLGGTRLRPRDKIVALDGFDYSAVPVLLHTDDLSLELTIQTPSYNRMKEMSSEDDIMNPTTRNGRTVFRHSSFVILPPFLFNPLISMDTREPVDMLIHCNRLITEFDSAIKDDPNYVTTADDQCKHVISFLWSASHNLVKPVSFVPATDDIVTKRWSTTRHATCILPQETDMTTNDNGDMLLTLANSIQVQTQFFEQFQQDRKADKDEKRQKFDDLHESSKTLILNASSTDGHSPTETPSAHCCEFFKKQSVSKAADYLTTTLTQEYNCCVSIESGLVTALYSGHFQRDREDSPGNFSFFLTPKKTPLSSSQFKPMMILQLKTSQGKGWSEMDMKEALKQGIVTPTDMNVFAHQLRNFWGLAAFFFGTDSVLPKRLIPLMAQISKHTITFEGCQIRDNQFATKLGYAIDTRVFRWIQQCASTGDREMVDDSLLAFDSIIQQIMTDSFIQYLPLTFKSAPQLPKNTQAEPTQQKRPRLANDDRKARVENEGKIEDWIVSHDTWGKLFAGKQLENRPNMNNKTMCTRFHSKGYCFSDCYNGTTHIPSTKLDSKIRDAYNKFFKSVVSK